MYSRKPELDTQKLLPRRYIRSDMYFWPYIFKENLVCGIIPYNNIEKANFGHNNSVSHIFLISATGLHLIMSIKLDLINLESTAFYMPVLYCSQSTVQLV